MPGRDRTGPEGRGPMTGGGYGPCGNSDANDLPVGNLMRMRRRLGGMRRRGGAQQRLRMHGAPGRYREATGEADTIDTLKSRLSATQQILDDIQKRIDQVSSNVE